jgi:hypothetical protein
MCSFKENESIVEASYLLPLFETKGHKQQEMAKRGDILDSFYVFLL